jgi:hypothetical protein
MPQEKEFPEHIAHKPVYVVPYFELDPWSPGDTDAQFITLGWSQWDQRELSAKVVRHSGQRWSRQSEELPLPRVIDLALLTAIAFERGDSLLELPAGTFEHQRQPIEVVHGSKKDRTAAASEMRNDPVLKARLRALYDALKPLRDSKLI